MLNENILFEMTQRPGEKTHHFLSRQQTVKNVIRKMNALEVHLGHLMADEEYRGQMGSSIMNKNEARNNTPTKAEESVPSIA